MLKLANCSEYGWSVFQEYEDDGLADDLEDKRELRTQREQQRGGCRQKKKGRRWMLLAKIEQLGMYPKLFGVHSLQVGGATAAANAEVPDLLLKCHGH